MRMPAILSTGVQTEDWSITLTKIANPTSTMLEGDSP